MILAALLSTAQATVYAELLDVDELSSTADQVVLGEVSEVTSRRTSGGIVTDITVEVFETLLGTPATDLILTLPGGSIGGETLTVSGVPHLLAGHDLLLFLDDGRPVGFTQGIFYLAGPQVQPVDVHRPAVDLEEVRRSVR